MVVATKLRLSRQKYLHCFVATSFLATNAFVTTEIILSRQDTSMFVATKMIPVLVPANDTNPALVSSHVVECRKWWCHWWAMWNVMRNMVSSGVWNCGMWPRSQTCGWMMQDVEYVKCSVMSCVKCGANKCGQYMAWSEMWRRVHGTWRYVVRQECKNRVQCETMWCDA